MVIYEVNLEIEPSAFKDFILWHQGHMAEIIALPGVERAIVYKTNESDNCLTVQYHLKSMDALEHYATNYVPKLKAEGQEKFPNKFTFTRRILKRESTMEGQI
jgi:hypothetical protein